MCSSSGLYAHEIIDVAILTATQLSSQTADKVILLKVSNDPLITKSSSLFFISILLEVSVSPEEAYCNQEEETWVWEWWKVRGKANLWRARNLNLKHYKAGSKDSRPCPKVEKEECDKDSLFKIRYPVRGMWFPKRWAPKLLAEVFSSLIRVFPKHSI